MSSTSTALPVAIGSGPVRGLGRSVLAMTGYVGGVTLMASAALGSIFWPRQRTDAAIAPGFWKTLTHQLFWMLAAGVPLVALVHIAVGSFLSLQAYYGSTFVDGTGAVVGVGLLRNLGGLMTGLTFSGILAARMVPELRILSRYLQPGEAAVGDGGANGSLAEVGDEIDGTREPRSIPLGRLAAPRITAAGIACVLLSQWGIAVGTIVGWQASQSMMGLPTATFFMMMMKMMWFRDVVGLVVKGLVFGALPATICCYEGLGEGFAAEDCAGESISPSFPAHGLAPSWCRSVFRATCLSCTAILVLNSSWFMLVYHAVPFYGPTLLEPPRL